MSAPIPTAKDPLYGLCTHLIPPQPGERVLVRYGAPFFGIVQDSDYLTHICEVRSETDGQVHFSPSGCLTPAPKFAIGDRIRMCRDSTVVYGIVQGFNPDEDEYVVKDLNSSFSFANIRPLKMQLAPLEPQRMSIEEDTTGQEKTYAPSSPDGSPFD
jgi:hypothetical protein